MSIGFPKSVNTNLDRGLALGQAGCWELWDTEVQPHAWMYSLLHSLYFLPISPAQDVFWPDRQTPITSIPCGPWHSKLKQWLLRKSQALKLCPSPNLPTNWTSSHQIYPTRLTWRVFALASSNSLPVWIPKESFISPPQLPTNLWKQTPASRLCYGVTNLNMWRGWIWNTSASIGLERQQEEIGSVGYERIRVPLQRCSHSDLQMLCSPNKGVCQRHLVPKTIVWDFWFRATQDHILDSNSVSVYTKYTEHWGGEKELTLFRVLPVLLNDTCRSILDPNTGFLWGRFRGRVP